MRPIPHRPMRAVWTAGDQRTTIVILILVEGELRADLVLLTGLPSADRVHRPHAADRRMTAIEASAIVARAIAQPRTARKSPNACEPNPTAMTGTVRPT